MEELKDRLKMALELRGMTAAELARRSEVDKGAISHYLKGEFTPKQSTIGKMARALNVSPSWLLGFGVTMDGKERVEVDVSKLSDLNREKLLAYYQALLDTQGENNGDT